MKFILRQAGLTAVFFAVLYGMVLALTFIVEPDPPRDGGFDAWDAYKTLYLTAPKYEFLGRDALNVPDKKVLLIGASNTALGFRLPQMRQLVPCAKFSNLALGNANITETRQMVDIAQEVENTAARRSNTWVIGVWYGMFVDTDLRWPGANRQHGETDLDIEFYRYGFYRRTPHGPVAVLPPSWLHTEVVMIRPYLLLEKYARNLTARLRQALFVRQPDLTDTDRERKIMSDKEKADALVYWHHTMGGTTEISHDQVALLQDLIASLLKSGEKVVLVDLPLPKWHSSASPYEQGYEKAINAVFDRFAGQSGFASLRMPDLDADLDYSDEVHAKPHLARVWATRLASVLDPLVCNQPGASNSSAALAAHVGSASLSPVYAR